MRFNETRTIRDPSEDHASYDLAVFQTTSHNLDHTDVVDVEVCGILGQHGEDGLGDEAGEEVLTTRLFRGDHGPDSLAQLFLRSHVLHPIHHQLFQRLQSELLRLLVAQHDIRTLQSHPQQFLRLPQQLACQDNNHVGRVSHLGLLLLTRHDDEFGGGVDDIEFSEDSGRIGGEDHLLKMVDDDLVPTIWAQRCLYRLCDRTTRIDVPKNRSIFGFVAR